MYEFIKNQWIMGKYTKDQVQFCITKSYITETQGNTILAIKPIKDSEKYNISNQ